MNFTGRVKFFRETPFCAAQREYAQKYLYAIVSFKKQVYTTFMISAPSPLKKAFHLLNTLPLPIAVIFLLDRSFLLLYLRGIINTPESILFVTLLHIPFKVYILSGIYGTLIEIASEEGMTFRLKDVKRNSKEYWSYYLFLSALPVLIYYSLFPFFPQINIPLISATSHFDILVVYAFTTLVIRKKYIKAFHLTKKKIALKIKDITAIAGLYITAIIFFYFFQTPAIQYSNLWSIPFFFFKYLNLLTFLYLTILLLESYPEIKEKIIPKQELFLINPLAGGIFNGLAFTFTDIYPPWFVVIKALTPKNYSFREFSYTHWHNRYYKQNKLVAITCLTSSSAEAYKIAKEFRKYGSKVIMGGPHVTYLPDEALQYCDSVVIGEAEGIWKEVIKDYENGTLKQKYRAEAKPEDYKAIHQELLNSPPEVIRNFLETTRGCKFHCYFCTIPSICGGRLIKKDPEEIVELLRKVKSQYKEIIFIDNNIYADPTHAKKLFAAIKPLHVKWSAPCSIDIAQNDEALKLARESGCDSLLFGYEILEDSAEKQRGGKLTMAGKYIQFTEKTKKTGIAIEARFIFGFDSDTPKALLKMFQFVFLTRPRLTVINLLTPLPGAQCYYDMLRDNRITNLNWRNYNMRYLVFKHPTINPVVLSWAPPILTSFLFLTTTKLGNCLFLLLVFSIIGLVLALNGTL